MNLLGGNNTPTVFDTYNEIGNKAKNDLINLIVDKMGTTLSGSQLLTLNHVLNETMENFEVFVDHKYDDNEDYTQVNNNLIELYLKSKEIEGLSPRTINAYKQTLLRFNKYLKKAIPNVVAEDVRGFISGLKSEGNVSNVTVDNNRRFLSSFFGWLHDEGYIIKNPMKQIKRIKSKKQVKKPYTQVEITRIRDYFLKKLNKSNGKHNMLQNLRNLAMFELLLSSGIRASELCGLNQSDINFNNNSCIVTGKGDKERRAYFDDNTSYRLKQYIKLRNDVYEPLFISQKTKDRLMVSGLGRIFNKAGKDLSIDKVHPHRFRRTFATGLVKRGMAIEQVSKLLGHEDISTTMIYCSVNEEDVAYGHHKYI